MVLNGVGSTAQCTSARIALWEFKMAAPPVGISHVRIPVAYWYWQVEEGEPFPTPNLDDQDETRWVQCLDIVPYHGGGRRK